jgi:hypothetical protein
MSHLYCKEDGVQNNINLRKRWLMKKLIKRFASLVKGSINGFDRIVFKGFIIPLMTAQGAMSFCRANRILNKDYKSWMMKQTQYIVDSADQFAKASRGKGIIPIPTWRIRKEQVAHDSRFRIVGKNDPKIGPFSGLISMISATYQIPDPQNT